MVDRLRLTGGWNSCCVWNSLSRQQLLQLKKVIQLLHLQYPKHYNFLMDRVGIYMQSIKTESHNSHATVRFVPSRNVRTVPAAVSLCLICLILRYRRQCEGLAERKHLMKVRRRRKSVEDKTGGTSLAMKRCN